MTTKIEIPQSTPIVEKIEITKLPEKLQKKALIFDKDKSNYIETKNNNGIINLQDAIFQFNVDINFKDICAFRIQKGLLQVIGETFNMIRGHSGGYGFSKVEPIYEYYKVYNQMSLKRLFELIIKYKRLELVDINDNPDLVITSKSKYDKSNSKYKVWNINEKVNEIKDLIIKN